MTKKWHEDRFHLSFLNKKQKILANVLFFFVPLQAKLCKYAIS